MTDALISIWQLYSIAWRTSRGRILLATVLVLLEGLAWPVLALSMKGGIDAAVSHAQGSMIGCGIAISVSAIGVLLLHHFSYVPYAEACDMVEIDLDIRTLPGETAEDVDHAIEVALGDLASSVVISALQESNASSSPWDTPLRRILEEVTRAFYPGASLVPRMTTGGTDARFFRERGAVAYGFGLFSDRVSLEDFASRFHGNDERVDVASLAITTQMWIEVVKQLGK